MDTLACKCQCAFFSIVVFNEIMYITHDLKFNIRSGKFFTTAQLLFMDKKHKFNKPKPTFVF